MENIKGEKDQKAMLGFGISNLQKCNDEKQFDLDSNKRKFLSNFECVMGVALRNITKCDEAIDASKGFIAKLKSCISNLFSPSKKANKTSRVTVSELLQTEAIGNAVTNENTMNNSNSRAESIVAVFEKAKTSSVSINDLNTSNTGLENKTKEEII